MSQQTSTISKFISLTTLGLLTSTSLTLTHLLLPTLSSLPTPSLALSSLTTLRQRTTTLQSWLSNMSLAALGTAWILSARRARHPYLLWTCVPVLGLVGWDVVYPVAKVTGSGSGGVDGVKAKGKGKQRVLDGGLGEGSSEDEDGWRNVDGMRGGNDEGGEGEVNGEVVRDGIWAFRREMGVKGLVWGLAWGLAQVGIWGDGC